jgi:hypothetical protein
VRQKQRTRWRLGAYGMILLSFFLRVYALNDVAVEKAEQMSISWFIRCGLTCILTQNKDLNNHPLNSLLAYLTSLGGESVFTLRWYSVVIGVVAVAAIFRLAREWFSERDAFIAGVLVGISAYHVALSHVSRGYASQIGLTVLGLYFAYRAVQTERKRYWLGFVVMSFLNIYTHLYGAMAVAVIGLIILMILAKRQLTPQRSLRRISLSAFIPLILSLVIIYVISFALYLPMLADTMSIAGQDNQFKASDVRHADEYTGYQRFTQPIFSVIRPFSLAGDSSRLVLDDPTLHYSSFDAVAALAEGGLGFYLSLGSVLLGLIFSGKYRWQTIMLGVWLVAPFALQEIASFVVPGAYFRGRFLAFIYPPYLLLVARGWSGLSNWLATRADGRLLPKLLPMGIGWPGIGALIVLNLGWLGAYYSAAAQEHWNDVARHISQNMQPHDVFFCGQMSNANCSFDLSTRLDRDVKEQDTKFVSFEEVEANRSAFEQPGRVWVVMPHLRQWQIIEIKSKVNPNNFWLAGDPRYDQVGWMLIDSWPKLGDNFVAALSLDADLSLSLDDKFVDYAGMARIHLVRNQLAAAEKAFDLASKLVADGSTPGQTQVLAELTERLQYARLAVQPIENLPPTAVSANLNFSGMARLAAYEVDRSTLSPGEALHVNLYWQPLTPIKRNLTSFVNLTDSGAHLIGQAGGIPAGGKSPTVAWEPGHVITDSYTITLDVGVQAPFVLNIEAGLYDPKKNEFIKAVDNTGQEARRVIAQTKVVPATWPTARPTHELSADFAGLISLRGYDLVADPPGIVLYWQAQTPMSEDFTVFVHLLDANGQVVGQMDGQPLQGNYPTSWWSPGELIIDRRAAPLKVPGSYRLLVGWYRLSDGSRLSLAAGSGDSIDLGTFTIR